ncbi:NADPH-dependent FMN reductase [Sphingobacterium corticibacter]|uniref:NADPH-dependent FMN reductase n=1 Tax=Sphingobacterium corticibacter TaxID=2171749 RepID=A0A2T8HIP3_9SPHI|nr:NAD(P)H-dependent oxidoreductase [Sphingobacterium corticibacter]PVH25263.1 NADPH-dependent FMN reductase [Sphingobacterium corticibacter]
MKVLAFGASNSSKSINQKFATSVSKYYKEDEVEILHIHDFEMPIYSADRERENGVPQLAYDFASRLDAADLIIISFAEHNGNYSAGYKNLIDWVSRIKGRKPYQDAHLFLLSTSFGARGGQSVMEIALARMPRDGGTVIEHLSLPEFPANFEDDKGVTNALFRSQLEAKVRKTKREMQKILDSKQTL